MPRQIKKRTRAIESCKNNTLTDIPPPQITLPWPPVVSIDDFVRNRPISKVDIKSPNSFFVYRAAYVKQLLIEQHKFKMTQVSKYASLSWKKEPKEVKNAYKMMAQKIDKQFQDRRKAIKGYRIVCEKFTPSEEGGPCINSVEEEKEEVKEEIQENQEEQEIIKQEPVEHTEEITFISQIPQQPAVKDSSSELGNWQPQPNYSEIFIPYMTSTASPKSPSLSDNVTIYDSPPLSPISPLIQQDFPLSEQFSSIYLPINYTNGYTENCNFVTPVLNTELYSPVDVNVSKSIWNPSSNCSNDAEYYNVEQGSVNFIESPYLHF